MGHPDEVAAHVDEHVAHVAHRVGILKLEKLIDEAMLVLFPAEREAERTAALDARQVRLLEQISANGVATIIIAADQIGRAHVCTPVTNAHPVCRLPIEKT